MEMHAAIAEYDAVRERMTVHASTQVPYYVHLMLAQILDMDMSQIRVIKPHVGGGFGCRTEALNVELITALLARRAGGSVRMMHQPRGDLHHPSRPAARPTSASSSACARTAGSPRWNANATSAAAPIPATAW